MNEKHNTSNSTLPAVVIHGGAGPQLSNPAQKLRAHESLKRIVRDAFNQLLDGKTALEVTVWAASQLEDDPQFNAGTGGKLQFDGVARLSASLMDGNQSRFSGVMNLENTKNPIFVSAQLQKEKDRVLSGEGAKIYARKKNFPDYNPVTQESLTEWKQRKEKKNYDELTELTGTIGVVCVDVHGHLASATSTGGKGMEIRDRVGDSATVAGNYASKHAAVSSTGVGEELVESALAARIVIRVEDGQTLEKSFQKSFQEFKSQNGRGGAIGVDRTGAVCAMYTTPCMLHAIKTPDLDYVYPEPNLFD